MLEPPCGEAHHPAAEQLQLDVAAAIALERAAAAVIGEPVQLDDEPVYFAVNLESLHARCRVARAAAPNWTQMCRERADLAWGVPRSGASA